MQMNIVILVDFPIAKTLVQYHSQKTYFNCLFPKRFRQMYITVIMNNRGKLQNL